MTGGRKAVDIVALGKMLHEANEDIPFFADMGFPDDPVQRGQLIKRLRQQIENFTDTQKLLVLKQNTRFEQLLVSINGIFEYLIDKEREHGVPESILHRALRARAGEEE